MEAIGPVTYLRSTPPFDALPQSLFDAAVGSLEVGFHPAGTRLARAGGPPLDRLYVIRTGSVRLERDGQPVQVLEEGEAFGYTSLITRQATLDVIVEEDLLAYELPDAAFQRLRAADAAFAGHFAVGLGKRLRSSLERSTAVQSQADLSQEIAGLVARAPLWIDATARVGDAARLMRAEGTSSVLVRSEPPGIVTDRDFTDRVLAEGLGPDAPLARIVSRPLRTVPATTPMHEAWTTLLELGFHHLPLTREGEVVGLVTTNDLLKASARGPIAILRRVERLATRDSLPGYAEKVAEMDAALLAGGLDATVVAHLVSRLDDSLLGRILAWAEADLGPAPAPWAWVAFGAEARRERPLLVERDDALVHGGDAAEQRGWFQEFTERVHADLQAAGFARCAGKITARVARGTLDEWTRRFNGCIDERQPHPAALLFDLRKVGGALDVAPLEGAIARVQRNPVFLRFLARAAVEQRPPGSLALRLRGRSDADLEAQGILPVVSLARCYGLEVGTPARATLERLDAAAKAGLLSEGTHERVSQAYRFLVALRLRDQLRKLSEGLAPTSVVKLADLSAIERSRLKEAFHAIARWQDRAAYHYRTDFF